MAAVKAVRSVTPESPRRSMVAISHSWRSAARIRRALALSRVDSSARRTPHTAWKYGTMRGARNIAFPRASLA